MTVVSEEKKQVLIRRYNLDPARIMSSCDARFRDSIHGLTHGAGVDVVINCLSGELLDASVDLAAMTMTERLLNTVLDWIVDDKSMSCEIKIYGIDRLEDG